MKTGHAAPARAAQRATHGWAPRLSHCAGQPNSLLASAVALLGALLAPAAHADDALLALASARPSDYSTYSSAAPVFVPVAITISTPAPTSATAPLVASLFGIPPESINLRPVGPGPGLLQPTLRLAPDPSTGLVSSRPLFNPERVIVLSEGTFSTNAQELYTSTFDHDEFDVLADRWSTGTVQTSPTGRRFLGDFGAGGTRLRIGRVPAGRSVVVHFDVIAIGAWKGNSAPHPQVFGVRVRNGDEMIRTTFATVEGARQSYPEPYGRGDYPPLTQAVATNVLGYAGDAPGGGADGSIGDAVYRLRFRFDPPTATANTENSGGDDIVIEFFSENLVTPTSDSDPDAPSWGLDDITVSMTPNQPLGGPSFPSHSSNDHFVAPDNLNLGGGGFSGGGGGGASAPSSPANPTDPDTPDVPAPGAFPLALAALAFTSRRRRA